MIRIGRASFQRIPPGHAGDASRVEAGGIPAGTWIDGIQETIACLQRFVQAVVEQVVDAVFHQQAE